MSEIAIKFENISKQYRLGTIGTGTISHDLNRWWARVRGKEDPYLKIGQENVLTTHRIPNTEHRIQNIAHRLPNTDHPDYPADNRASRIPDFIWALKDINLEVKQGEVLGIIGKNGAGKSTLLKILSRVTTPTTGIIKARGRIASLLEVGTGFHPEMTGRENIFMNGSIMGMTKAEIKRKFDEIVDFAGVETYIDTPVKRYSSGMTVRLGFAIAAHLEPEILVVDEVLAVGDAEFQKKAIGKMQDVSRGNGRTVLFVSHNMQAIRALCLQAVLLKNGAINKFGLTENIIDKYLNQNFYSREIVQKIDRSINWTGIINQESLKNLPANKDIDICFSFYTNSDLNNIYIDFAIYKNIEEVIIHGRSKNIIQPFLFECNKTHLLQLHLKAPFLMPGTYYITMYIHSASDIFLWIDNIMAFSINEMNYFGLSAVFDNTKAIINTEYKIVKS